MSSPAKLVGGLGRIVGPFCAPEVATGRSEVAVAVVQAASAISTATARAVERRLWRSKGERIEVGSPLRRRAAGPERSNPSCANRAPTRIRHEPPVRSLTMTDDHPRPISRRRFLERSAMAVAGGVLFSCTGGSTTPRVSPSSSAAMRLDTQWPVKRVIYLMLENRSFDNLFGRFPGVEGTTVGNMLGKEKPLLRCPDWLPGDLGHDRGSALAEYDDG